MTNKALLNANNYPDHYQQPTEFGDIDSFGHANNLAIARYYENARARWLMRVFSMDIYRLDHPVKPVLVEVTTQYIGQIFYPETVRVTTGINHIGTTSFSVSQAIFRKEQCVGLCTATIVYVENSKPTPIPAEARATMEALKVKNS
jgi:acyl-CoA thioester hydrolase